MGRYDLPAGSEMSLVLALFLFTVVVLAGGDWWLRRRSLYGQRNIVWIWIEYIWLLLSFIGLMLAVVQLHDKTLAAEIEQLKSEWAVNIVGEKWLASVITAEMTDPAVLREVEDQAAPKKFAIAVLPALKNLAANPFPLPYSDYATLYDGQLKDFCIGYLGSDIIIGEGSFNHYMAASHRSLTKAEDVEVESGAFCSVADGLSKLGKYASDHEEEKQRYQAAYWLSGVWSFFIGAGIALKALKVKSDRAQLVGS
jgi:hypothetical protein